MSATDAIIYVDGNQSGPGNDGTYVEGDPLHPRKTFPVDANFGTNSTRVIMKGTGLLNGVRAVGRVITSRKNVSLEAWPGFQYEIRTETPLTNEDWTNLSPGLYRATIPVPAFGICGASYKHDTNTVPTFAGSPNVRAGLLEFIPFANVSITNMSAGYDSATQHFFVNLTGAAGSVDLNAIGYVDGDGVNAIRFVTCQDVTVTDFAAAVYPGSSGGTGYFLRFEGCTGKIKIWGRLDGSSFIYDPSAHAIGILDSDQLTSIDIRYLSFSGMLESGTFLVVKSSSVNQATQVTTDAIFWYPHRYYKPDATGTEHAAVSSGASQIGFLTHSDGATVFTTPGQFKIDGWKMVETTGKLVGNSVPQPISIANSAFIFAGDRLDPSKYLIRAKRGQIVNGRIWTISMPAIFLDDCDFNMPQSGVAGGAFGGMGAVSLGFNGDAGSPRFILWKFSKLVCNTDCGDTSQVRHAIAISTGTAGDKIIMRHVSVRNNGQEVATNFRGMLQYNGRGDDCFDVKQSIFENAVTNDANSVYAFCIGDNSPSVGAVRSIDDNSYAGIKSIRFSADAGGYTFAQWKASVDTHAVNYLGQVVFPNAGVTSDLSLSASSAVWRQHTVTTTERPENGINGLPFDKTPGPYQYGAGASSVSLRTAMHL